MADLSTDYPGLHEKAVEYVRLRDEIKRLERRRKEIGDDLFYAICELPQQRVRVVGKKCIIKTVERKGNWVWPEMVHTAMEIARADGTAQRKPGSIYLTIERDAPPPEDDEPGLRKPVY